MRRDTRRNILDAAQLLFNKSGYNGVSLHDIAQYVGISKGNLTYYFPNKEDLMNALIDETTDTLPKIIPSSLHELDVLFTDMHDAINKYSYFFMYHAQLSQASQDIASKQYARYNQICHTLQQSFILLQMADLICAPKSYDEYDCIIDELYMSIIYWKPFSELRSQAGCQPTLRRHIWNIMSHILTDKGLIELASIINSENEL